MGFFADAGPVQGIYVNKHVRENPCNDWSIAWLIGWFVD
jgi:hypothetical protein